jgi:hypothetical protein
MAAFRPSERQQNPTMPRMAIAAFAHGRILARIPALPLYESLRLIGP